MKITLASDRLSAVEIESVLCIQRKHLNIKQKVMLLSSFWEESTYLLDSVADLCISFPPRQCSLPLFPPGTLQTDTYLTVGGNASLTYS